MKHLILKNSRYMTDINVGLFQCFINFLIKRVQAEQLKLDHIKT